MIPGSRRFSLKNHRTPVWGLAQILQGYGWPLFAGRETFCRRPMDVIVDFTASGQKWFGLGSHKLEPRPQSLAADQADDKALHACRTGVPAREFYALGRRIENRDRIERQRQFRPLTDAGKSTIAWWAVTLAMRGTHGERVLARCAKELDLPSAKFPQETWRRKAVRKKSGRSGASDGRSMPEFRGFGGILPAEQGVHLS